MQDEPRQHHYRFAHRYLARVVFKSPDRLQDELHTNGVTTLVNAWKEIGKELPRKDRLRPDGLALDWARFGDREVAVIALPPPVAPGEAYFVGIVFGGSLMPDVFTLEVADPNADTGGDDAGNGTSFGAWKVDGSREAFPASPAPQASEFVRAILESLGFVQF